MGKSLVASVVPAILLTCGYVASASANVVYTSSISSQDAANYASPGISVMIPQYNPTGNPALLGVVVTISSSSIANISITNLSQTNYSFTNASASTTVNIGGPVGYNVNLTTTSTLASGVANAGNGIAPGVTNYPGITGSSYSQISVPLVDLSNFEGAGNFALTFINYAGSATYGGTATLAPSQTLYFGGGDNLAFEITVDYETVPEPATLMMLGTGLIGLARIRNRRRV